MRDTHFHAIPTACCGEAARSSRELFRRRGPYEARIMVRSILKRDRALTAWG